MTPANLVKEMDRRGYAVTPRGLASWRAKGLLPKLEMHGKGQRQGTVQAWSDPDIIGRTILVCELLARKSRSKDALLGVWGAGHDADLFLVREAWQAKLNGFDTSVKLKASKCHDLEDLLGTWASRLSKRITENDLSRGRLSDLLSEILRAGFAPRYKMEKDIDVADYIDAIVEMCRSNQQISITSEHVSADMISHWLSFIHKHFSLESMNQTIASASFEELLEAHRRWKKIIATIRTFFVSNLGELSAPEPDEIPIWIAILQADVGQWAIIVLLYCSKYSFGTKIDELLHQLQSVAKISEQALPRQLSIQEGL